MPMGPDKNSDITHKLPAQAKYTQLEENLVYWKATIELGMSPEAFQSW